MLWTTRSRDNLANIVICCMRSAAERRVGDFQYFLERAMSDEQTYVLHVISLDVVVDATWGDVANAQTRRFWLEAIRSRWVLAFLGGPPCESWSRVRV